MTSPMYFQIIVTVVIFVSNVGVLELEKAEKMALKEKKDKE